MHATRDSGFRQSIRRYVTKVCQRQVAIGSTGRVRQALLFAGAPLAASVSTSHLHHIVEFADDPSTSMPSSSSSGPRRRPPAALAVTFTEDERRAPDCRLEMDWDDEFYDEEDFVDGCFDDDSPPPIPTAPKPISAPSTPLLSTRRFTGNPFLAACGATDRHTWPISKLLLRRPMFELIDGEKKYIDVLATTIDVYLTDYIRANAEASLPQALRGKEAAIFGNIRKLFHFHKDVFINDLISYTDNPTLIGCAFVNNIDRLRELYTEYIVNKEQNDQLVHSPEVVRFFEEVRARHPVIARLEAERNVALKLDSVLMWPVQRLFKYGLLLKRLIELAPYEIAEIRDVAESVGAITTYANDYIKLLAFEDFRNHQITEFVMTDEFIVTEPKRMFKREKDYQVFLFENNLILAKKERDETGTHYCFKDRIMLNDVYVVEHVDSSNIKFGLRRQSPSTSATTDNTFIFRADSERTQQRWVKTLRNLMAPFVGLPGKKSSTSLGGASLGFSDNSASPVSSNRNSRASRDSYDFVGAAGATENTAPLNSNNNKAFQLSNVGVGVGDPPPSPHCP